MKQMLVVLVLVAPLAVWARDDADKKDLQAMQGDWALDQLTSDGKRSSDDEAQAFSILIPGPRAAEAGYPLSLSCLYCASTTLPAASTHILHKAVSAAYSKGTGGIGRKEEEEDIAIEND